MAKVLVIDDDELMRITLRTLLEEEGHTVLEASDGREGVDVFNNNGADLIITDVMMPKRSGIDVLEKLRAASPNLKIIVISGASRFDNADMLRMASILGAERTFHKPINKVEMVSAVREALS